MRMRTVVPVRPGPVRYAADAARAVLAHLRAERTGLPRPLHSLVPVLAEAFGVDPCEISLNTTPLHGLDDVHLPRLEVRILARVDGIEVDMTVTAPLGP